MTDATQGQVLEASLSPAARHDAEVFGLKLSGGGAHISRTMMLAELSALLAALPVGASASDYRGAVLDQNILGKNTGSTREKTFRHLRELYALDAGVPLFALLRKLHSWDTGSLPLLALQVAWGRDPLFRATTGPVAEADEGATLAASALAEALEEMHPHRFSPLNRDKIARNASSSWTQSGHLVGRARKIRRKVNPTPVAATLALFLGTLTGFHGSSVFSNPWCRLLDMDPTQARSWGMQANRAGLLNLRAMGEVVEIRFPRFAEFKLPTP